MSAKDHIDHIVRRRMANTGETEEVARAYVLAMHARVSQESAQSGLAEEWLSVWMNPELRATRAVEEAIAQEVRSLPEAVRDLVIAFPPASVVRTKPGRGEHVVPAPGRHGLVYSVIEGERPLVAVIAHPGASFAGRCFPEDLEVVGFHLGWDHDRVRKALGR